MRKDTTEVRSRGTVVAIIDYNVYDSVTEAVEGLGEATALSLINAQVKTNARNTARAGATGKPSKTKLRQMAFSEISVEEFSGVAGDALLLENLVNQKMAEIEARLAASTPAPDPVEDEDEDED